MEQFLDTCVVRVSKPSTFFQGNSKECPVPLDFSCSGVVIQPSKGLILTSGVVFTEVVKHRPRIFSRVATKPYRHHWFQPGGGAPKNVKYYSPRDLEASKIEVGVEKGNRKQSGKKKDGKNFAIFDAELIVLWKCETLADEIQRLFPANDNWHFVEEVPRHDGRQGQQGHATTRTWDDEKDQHFVEPVGMSSMSKDETVENFVSWMALLRIKNPNKDVIKIR